MNHKKLQFELWLLGQNADVHKKYREIMRNTVWSSSEMPKYTVLETVLENQIDFRDEENMTKRIISRAQTVSSEILQYLEADRD